MSQGKPVKSVPPVAAKPDATAGLVTRKELAAMRGVTLSHIARLAREGVLPVRAGNKLDQEECTAILDALHDPDRSNDGHRNGKTTGLTETSTLHEIRLVHETYKAELAKLKYDAEAGLLVERAQVEREAYAEGRATRDAFQGLGARLRDRLAGEDDPATVQKAIDEEVFRILTELADAKGETT